MSRRIGYLETMRGLACILLVFFHVIGSSDHTGLRLPSDHALRVFNALLQDARMPMFSFISGFVFFAVSANWDDLALKLKTKFRRLFIPMIAAATFLFVLKVVTKQNDQPYYEIFYLPYEQFWYLQATILLMTLHYVLTYMTKQNHVVVAIALAAMMTAAYVTAYPMITPVFSLNGATYLAPYFFGGYVVAHWFKNWAMRPPPQGVARYFIPLFLLVMIAAQYPIKTAYLDISDDGFRILRVLFGIGVCLAFLTWRRELPLLSSLGSHSYAIFLYHVIFTAGTRVVIGKLLPGASPYFVLWPCLVAGLLGPLILEFLFLKNRVTALVFLGIQHRDAKVTTPSEVPATG